MIETLFAEQYKGKERLLDSNVKALHLGRDYVKAYMAAPLGIRWEHGAEAHFMVLELQPGALAGVSGVARYRPEFDGV